MEAFILDTYKRQIKFCYYKVALLKKINETEHEIVGDYNLVNWFQKIENMNKLNHRIELSDSYVVMDQIYYYENRDIYALRAFKVRDVNVPSKIKDGKEAEPIPLGVDEYIGEDMNWLYDREKSICMIQQNRMSIGIARLSEWVNKMIHLDGFYIKFIPILDKFMPSKLQRKHIRSIDFSFINLAPDNKDGSLAQIIRNVDRLSGLSGKISISVGHSKNKELNPIEIMDLVEDIRSNPGLISSAKIKLRDDDKPRVEIVDLLEESLHDFIEYDIELKKPLDFDVARAGMCSRYLERREEINKSCRW